jgi:hypothetical protein
MSWENGIVSNISYYQKETRERTMTIEPSWYKSFRAALLETDWTKIHQLIVAAESEIRMRQNMLAEGQSGTPTERYALANAMNSLRGLQGDLAFWQKSAESAMSRGQATAQYDRSVD